MERTRVQLVFEALEEDRRFIASCLSERDDSDSCRRFSVDDRHGEVAKESKCNEALFVVVETIVFERV
jgi:hypothetical protein